MKTTKKLTRLQEDVLYIVKEHGPVSAREVAYHLPITEESARGVLNRLEARSLIDATYTDYGSNRRAYV
jgi:predicted ArsR family transcriptional regulator